MSADLQAEQQRDWHLLHDAITRILDRYGVKNHLRQGDYWLLDENWGRYSQQLEFQNLQLFHPVILGALQDLLPQFPHWCITIRVDVVGKEDEWPGMGVLVYRDRMVDDLRREYLPARFQNIIFGAKASDEVERVNRRVKILMDATRKRDH
jgi:hypothetical protein